MVHDLSPFLWRISGEFGLRWYGLAYIAGFVCAYYLIKWFCERQRSGLTPAMVSDFITYVAIGTLVGGRLGYVLFYSFDLVYKFKSTPPFWGVLAVNEGGMASHGGMIGLVVAATLFSLKHGISRLYLYDVMCVAGPIGVFFGRIANYINGELVGRVCDPSFPWAVKFPQDIYQWTASEFNRLPGLAEVWDKIPGGSKVQWLEWLDKYRYDGSARESIQSGLYQMIDSIQSGNSAAKEAIGPLLDPRYPSQLFAAFGEGLLIFVILFVLWYKPRKPGIITATFVTLYSIVRITDEYFRMPDAHIGYQLLGLTRGQWLSIGMLSIGLILIFVWGRREGLATPGWGRGQHVKLHRK